MVKERFPFLSSRVCSPLMKCFCICEKRECGMRSALVYAVRGQCSRTEPSWIFSRRSSHVALLRCMQSSSVLSAVTKQRTPLSCSLASRYSRFRTVLCFDFFSILIRAVWLIYSGMRFQVLCARSLSLCLSVFYRSAFNDQGSFHRRFFTACFFRCFRQ